MPCQLLIDYFERDGVSYQLRRHAKAYSAHETVRNSGISPRQFAKVVLVYSGQVLQMLVMPADYHLDWQELSTLWPGTSLRLATEKEFLRRFPRCEPGAIPPFGHLYGLNAYLVPAFDCSRPVAFSAGSHSLMITMAASDFYRLAGAEIISKGLVPENLGSQHTLETPLEKTRSLMAVGS